MGLNVLVVDDSAVMRAMIVRTLRLTGLPLGTVSQAGSAEEGLDILARDWIDLALVDLNMPGMGGEEMIVRVRQTPSIADLMVVVVSSESCQTRIDRLRETGAAFVHKPFEPVRLRQIIDNLMGAADGEQDPTGATTDFSFDF